MRLLSGLFRICGQLYGKSGSMRRCSCNDMAMARAGVGNELLVFFEAQCRGVKFYDLADTRLDFGVPIAFRRDPSNKHDDNCVEVYLRPAGWLRQEPPRADLIAAKLGHVDRASAKWLSTLLTAPFRISG